MPHVDLPGLLRWPSAPVGRVAASCLALLLLCPPAPAQTDGGQPLRLKGLYPAGARASTTDGWGAFQFSVQNLSDQDRDASVLVFHGDSPQVHYGRDLWGPANSVMSSWMLVGPGAKRTGHSNEIQSLLYERAGGAQRLLLPATEERLRSRVVLYRGREPSITVVLEDAAQEQVYGQLPQPEARDDEVVRLLKTFRHARGLSQLVNTVPPGWLLPEPQALDGIDLFVIASARVAHEPAGIEALRHWLEQGGKAWVLLDLVDEQVAAALLGEALDFHVVDRVGLTTTRVETIFDESLGAPLEQQHERPVELVRVLLPPGEQVEFAVNGWPAAFTRQVGRGEVLFTTLGARGWFRPRTRNDPRSPYEELPSLPVPLPPLLVFAERLQPPLHERELPTQALQHLLKEEIGYDIVPRRTVALIFAAVLGGALTLVIALRRSRHPELVGWLGPVTAVGGMLAFVLLGESSRRAAPPYVAVAQVVTPAPGHEEAALHGLVAVYGPDSGRIELGVRNGGFFEVDAAGLESDRRMVMTDMRAWHWDNLWLPAGVRFGPFRYAAPLAARISASARFGPHGVEGTINAGPFDDLSDAVLNTEGGRALSVRIVGDGAFQTGSEDALASGQFIAGAVLTDEQRLRQGVFRELLKPAVLGEQRAQADVLFAWSKPIDMHFTIPQGARLGGAALLAVPVHWTRSPAGQTVTVPGPFVSYRRLLAGKSVMPTLTSHRDTDMDLRFQVPPVVLPMKVQRARLAIKIDAPSRQVIIAGKSAKGSVELQRVENPLAPIRIDITQESVLQLDAQGRLHLTVTVSDLAAGRNAEPRALGGEHRWTIEYLDLEVTGQTAP
jgi:hypothetical protein